MMNTNTRLATHVEPDANWPLSKRTILAICLVAPMAGGLALYLLFRRSSPAAAEYANRVTLRGLVLVLAAGVFIAMVASAFVPRRSRSHDRRPAVPSQTTR